jgi:hypothetical protein
MVFWKTAQMDKTELLEYLESEGYFMLCEIPGRGICGLYYYIFTVGLVYGMGEKGYKGRYCYPNLATAKEALLSWDGKDDPKDDEWMKHKGYKEFSNPMRKEI